MLLAIFGSFNLNFGSSNRGDGFTTPPPSGIRQTVDDLSELLERKRALEKRPRGVAVPVAFRLRLFLFDDTESMKSMILRQGTCNAAD